MVNADDIKDLEDRINEYATKVGVYKMFKAKLLLKIEPVHIYYDKVLHKSFLLTYKGEREENGDKICHYLWKEMASANTDKIIKENTYLGIDIPYYNPNDIVEPIIK